MPGTDYRIGMPMESGGSPITFSRNAEFSSGITGGGTAHTVQQFAPTRYRPSSVLSPLEGSSNGQSMTTYAQNRILDYYRS